jgi:hypothetical protein
VNEQQKKAATAVSLLIVTAAALFLLWLALDVSSGTADSRHEPGKLFVLAIANWGGLGIALKSLPILLSIGLSFVGSYVLKDWLFYGLVAVSVLGAAAAIYLYMALGVEETAWKFWNDSPAGNIQSYEAFLSAAHTGLGVAIAWFVAVVLAELGIKRIVFS